MKATTKWAIACILPYFSHLYYKWEFVHDMSPTQDGIFDWIIWSYFFLCVALLGTSIYRYNERREDAKKHR